MFNTAFIGVIEKEMVIKVDFVNSGGCAFSRASSAVGVIVPAVVSL